ncbi:MAG: S8 family serine peptidase [Acidobacteriia bacterium]|nr:S8 family serine peptidase [Terriglobia bacterium]
MRSRRFTASTLALLLIFTLSASLSAQVTRRASGTDFNTHRFQPQGMSIPARNTSGKPVTISTTAFQQINALELDKIQRTRTQAKISSRVLYTSRMLQGLPAAIGVQYLRTGLELDNQNNIFVDIKAHVTDNLLKQLNAAGVRVIRSNAAYRTIRAFVPPSSVETIASLPDVIFIQPRQEAMTQGQAAASRAAAAQRLSPGFAQRAASVRAKLSRVLKNGTGQGSVTSEGDATHRTADGRATFGVTGAGMNIGVLSDGVDHLADSQATGDLGTVTILPGQGGAGDEGTAMLEIIHDLAPDANLFFATAFNGIDSFAQNIDDLRFVEGCDIIVDDVFYFVETPFQDGQDPSIVSDTDGGVVIQAVNDVTADGAMYFSSAGNAGNFDDNFSSSIETDFVNGGTNPLVPGGNLALFGTNQFDTITFDGFALFLWWTDPLGGSANDYDLFVLDSTGTVVLDSSTDVQDGTQDPIEATAEDATGDLAVVLQLTGAADRFFHLDTIQGAMELTSPGQVHGHAGAAQAFAVAATPAAAAIGTGFPSGPFPNPFNSTNVVEPYSSDGPRQIFFQADGTPITPGDFSSTGGLIRQKPDVTAADGVSVTGAGGFPTPFYGTSAAAPHAAAIAALLKTSVPSVVQTNDDVRTALTSSAIDIEGAGVDRDSGAGILDGFAALNIFKDFILPLTLSDETVTAGQSTTQDITIDVKGSWDTPITFACSGLPDKSSCTFTPSGVTPGASSAVVSVEVSTTAPMRASLQQPQGLIYATWLSFGGLGLVGMVGVGTRKRSRKALIALALLLLIPMLLTIVGCDNGGRVIPGTPTGTSAITVTATAGSGTGVLSHTTTFNLTVQ